MQINKKSKNSLSLLLLLLLLIINIIGCSKNISIQNPKGNGQISGAIWYIFTHDKDKHLDLPLLFQAEWENTPHVIDIAPHTQVNTQFAFIFLHGSLLAKCSIENNELICTNQSNIPNGDRIAQESAELIIEAIDDLQSKQITSLKNSDDLANKEDELIYLDKNKNRTIKLIIEEFLPE